MISIRRLNQILSAARFRIGDLIESHHEATSNDRVHKDVSAWLANDRLYKKLLSGILRNSFLVEIVSNESVSSTKVRTRWSLPTDDPRRASYGTCCEVYSELLQKLPQNDKTKETLTLFIRHAVLPYELPIDYKKKLDPIHQAANVIWKLDAEVDKVIKLRSLLLDAAQNTDASAFDSILKDKVKVKVYLTDRVLTGEHKTNREKRWEVHPNSVHFATRGDCFGIELELLSQLCHFKNFPSSLQKLLLQKGLITNLNSIARCPITFDELDFQEFKQSVLNPNWGRSNFQVGHLNPLKANPGNLKFSHAAPNIAWVTADGNRLQGHLTIDEWNILLKRIVQNMKTLKKI